MCKILDFLREIVKITLILLILTHFFCELCSFQHIFMRKYFFSLPSPKAGHELHIDRMRDDGGMIDDGPLASRSRSPGRESTQRKCTCLPDILSAQQTSLLESLSVIYFNKVPVVVKPQWMVIFWQ